MFDKADRKPISVPLFQSVANVLAEEMARMNVEELARQLDCSSKIFFILFRELAFTPPSPSENGRLGVYHRGQNRYHDST